MADEKKKAAADTSSASKDKKSKNEKKKESFFEGVKKEFRKIIWPTKDRLFRESTAVVVCSVVLGALIALLDAIIKYGVDYLVKL